MEEIEKKGRDEELERTHGTLISEEGGLGDSLSEWMTDGL